MTMTRANLIMAKCNVKGEIQSVERRMKNLMRWSRTHAIPRENKLLKRLKKDLAIIEKELAKKDSKK